MMRWLNFVREAVGVVLDCLTQDGLLSPVSEIRFMSLSVMVEVAKNAGPSIRFGSFIACLNSNIHLRD